MPSEPLWERPSRIMRPTDKCKWCGRPGAYAEGTKCMMDYPPILRCPVHKRWTDVNLVVRGRRAAIKCAHYENGGVVLWADPSADEDAYVDYTVQFYWPGLGEELYPIRHGMGTCPHKVFDTLVAEMRAGARPHPRRIPPAQTEAEAGQRLRNEVVRKLTADGKFEEIEGG